MVQNKTGAKCSVCQYTVQVIGSIQCSGTNSE